MKTQNEEMLEIQVEGLEKQVRKLTKSRTKWIRSNIFAWIIAIVILLLWKGCDEDRKDQIASLETKIGLLENKNDSLQTKNDEKDLIIGEKDSIINEKNSLKTVLRIRKVTFKNKAGKEISGKRVSIDTVPKSFKGVSHAFIEDYFVQVYIPCNKKHLEDFKPETHVYEYYDSLTAKVVEYFADSSRIPYMRRIPFPRSLYITNYSTKEEFEPNLAFKNSPEYLGKQGYVIPYRWNNTFKEVKVDERLVKRGKAFHWVGTGLRVLGFGTMAYLYRSDVQYAISVNGLDPYDPNNRFQPANSEDKKIAGGKLWAEWGAYGLYLTGEVLNQVSYYDLNNAYQIFNVSQAFIVEIPLNGGPINIR